MKRQIVAMMMVVLLSAAAENVRADVQYIVTDLGDLGGTSGSVAYDLNDSGQVVGTSYNTRGSNQVFLYSGSGPMQELGIGVGPVTSWSSTTADKSRGRTSLSQDRSFTPRANPSCMA